MLPWYLGITGVYKGLTATMMKQGSNQAIRFFVVESLKEWYKVSQASSCIWPLFRIKSCPLLEGQYLYRLQCNLAL